MSLTIRKGPLHSRTRVTVTSPSWIVSCMTAKYAIAPPAPRRSTDSCSNAAIWGRSVHAAPWLAGQGDVLAAVVHSTAMGGHKIGTGLMPGERADLHPRPSSIRRPDRSAMIVSRGR
ncbi:pPIWI_RE module domain-containing protein [Amycolatopsis deserti]|uniref:pPIWI_RE module domain-containing protein n=1 Tax=Amycolatopsis deserti TaxID=185696 RepID=UPI003571192F